MIENIITFPAKLGSNNPKAYGIVNATQVSGHRYVKTINDLYNLSDAILSESKDNTNNDAIGLTWWVLSENCYYRLISWTNRKERTGWTKSDVVYKDGTQIVFSDNPPEINNLWGDNNEKNIPQYVNEDLKSIISSIKALQEAVNRYEYIFNCLMSSGDFTNNTADVVTAIEGEEPVMYSTRSASSDVEDVETEFPQYALGAAPNLKHLCIKAGEYSALLENSDKFLNNELLWCTDVQRLYIKSGGQLIWINKATGGGGGDTPDTPTGGMTLEDLDKLETIGFIAPSGLTYRVKVNNDGELVVYMKELDTPQEEPTGGQTDESGWVYVTSLHLQKLYINSLYCGGLTADEHSYNHCSHNFVELSNLTDKDINLNGLSLQYSELGTNWLVLPLKGLIKAGSTFLIRGAQCSVIDANTTRIKVDKYDMEWYNANGELIKFDNTKAKFYLTWGTTPCTVANPYKTVTNADGTSSIRLAKGYIDLVGLNIENASTVNKIDAQEGKGAYQYLNSGRLFTKYYSMDKVKQATKALTARNNANDWYFVNLSEDIIPGVENYTPRASFENKDIFFNKTAIDETKPNYITCTFGIQATAPNATRCFNWISKDYHDEYLWYRQEGQSEWIKVESFKDETGVRKYYNRIRSEFTDGTPFVVHKVIIKNLSAGKYEYKVGRDDNYISDVKTFNVIDSPAEFSFVQVSDQQGFRWDEYQIWNEAAQYISENIGSAAFTINTGDITQNGNRVNEWLDYYDARNPLAHLEEMTVIGNNDLCPVNVYNLGAGEDDDKLNSINMSYFYTYEIDEENPPVFIIEDKEIYVDSLYYFNYGNTQFICVNSEIPQNTELYVHELSKNGQIYDKMKAWCEAVVEANSDKTWRIGVCHELPFTIITQYTVNQYYWDGVEYPNTERGGSRINTNNTLDNQYWFSKFCQNHDVRLVIGGHKHTYAATFPIFENDAHSMKPIILVTQSDLETWFNSTELYNGGEEDPQLEGWYFPSAWKNNITYDTQKHLCAFGTLVDGVYSPTVVEKITAPIYITNQATGYKHTSNKELPSALVPWDKYYFPCTSVITSKDKVTDTVNAGQRYPFYTIYTIGNELITCDTKKINNLFTSGGKYNVNIPSSTNPPVAIGGNGQTNNGNDIIVIER